MDHGATTYDQEQQRNDALAAANETRLNRAQMKRDIKAGRVLVDEILLDPPWYVEKMSVIELLIAMPKRGRIRATQVLNQTKIPVGKEVGRLTEHQRIILAGHLRP